jgi:hypothetical protein
MAYKEDFDENDSRDEVEMIIVLPMMESAAVRIGEAVGSIAALWRPIGLLQPLGCAEVLQKLGAGISLLRTTRSNINSIKTDVQNSIYTSI